MVKCNVCGGVYEQKLADGTMYFHACPPLSEAEIRTQLQQKTLQLTPAQQKLLDDAAKLDADPNAPKVDRSRVDQAISSLTIERPNKRDENVAGVGAPGQPAVQKSPGTGVTKL